MRREGKDRCVVPTWHGSATEPPGTGAAPTMHVELGGNGVHGGESLNGYKPEAYSSKNREDDPNGSTLFRVKDLKVTVGLRTFL